MAARGGLRHWHPALRVQSKHSRMLEWRFDLPQSKGRPGGTAATIMNKPPSPDEHSEIRALLAWTRNAYLGFWIADCWFGEDWVRSPC